MSFSGRWFDGDHLHAELGGALGQRPEHALAMAIFAAVLAMVQILLALGQHHVDHARQSVGCGEHRELQLDLVITRLMQRRRMPSVRLIVCGMLPPRIKNRTGALCRSQWKSWKSRF